jgi:plastocyanin
MRLKFLGALLAALALVTIPPALGKGGEPEIEAEDFAFHPARIAVRPGAIVELKNRDRAPHNAVSLAMRNGKRLFGTRTIGFRGTATLRAPQKRGTYRFICTVHPNMRGKLVVR